MRLFRWRQKGRRGTFRNLERGPCCGHAAQSAGTWVSKALKKDEDTNGDLRGVPVPEHGAKDKSACLSAAVFGWLNRSWRSYFGGLTIKAYFAGLGDYGQVAIGRETRHLSRFLVARYHHPRFENIISLATARSESLATCVVGKVLHSLVANKELMLFDTELMSVLHHGYLWRAFEALDKPDAFAPFVKKLLEDIDEQLDDDDAAIAAFTIYGAQILQTR